MEGRPAVESTDSFLATSSIAKASLRRRPIARRTDARRGRDLYGVLVPEFYAAIQDIVRHSFRASLVGSVVLEGGDMLYDVLGLFVGSKAGRKQSCSLVPLSGTTKFESRIPFVVKY